MFTADALVAHVVGDYLLQSHWVAQQKTSRLVVAVAHALLYALPFLLLTRSPVALLVIVATHAVIDRYRLVRYVIWLKNQWLAPPSARSHGAPTATGFPDETPPWLSVWLLIICDNLAHVAVNALAIRYL